MIVAAATFQPELVLQQGHTRSVVAVAISPDRRWLASGSQDSTVKIWNLANGVLLRTLYGHSGKINAVAISHDGQWIASAGEDKRVRLWGITTGNATFLFSGFQSSPTSVAFTTDNKFLVASNADLVKIFECITGNESRTFRFKEEDSGGRTLVSPDGRLVLIGGASGKPGGNVYRPLKVIELSTGRELAKIKVDVQTPFASIAFTPDGRLLAIRTSRSDNRTNQESIKILDSASGNEKTTLKIPGTGTPNATGAIAFSPDGKFLAAETELEENLTLSVHVFDVTNGQSIRQLTTGNFFTPLMNFDVARMISTPLAFSPDSQLVALGGANSIQLWETKTGKVLQPLRTNLKAGAITNAMDPKMAEALKQFGMTEEQSRQMRLNAGGILDQMTDPDNPLSQAMNFSKQFIGTMGAKVNTTSLFDKKVSFSGDGKWLVTERSRELLIWDLPSGTHLQLPFGATSPVAVSRDGRFVAAMEVDHNSQSEEASQQRLVIRDASTFTVRSQTKLESPPEAIVFCPDGNSVAILIRINVAAQIQILDASSGKVIRTLPLSGEPLAGSAAFSPNGRFLAFGGMQASTAMAMFTPMMPGVSMSKKDMKKMQEQLGKMMKTMQGQNEPVKYEIKLIDVQTGKPLSTLAAGSQQVKMIDNPQEQVSFPGLSEEHQMAFSADDNLIAIQDSNQQSTVIKLYEVSTGHVLATLPLNGKSVFAFSPDHKSMAITSQQDQYAIRLVSIPGGETIRVLQQPGRVDAVTFSPDGRFLVSMMQDGTRILWNSATGEKLATLVEFPGLNFTTEWLVTTPDGLFDGSPAAFNQILWRFSPNTFDVAPVEAFFNELYYPGLLGELYAGRSPKPVRDISQIDRRQPEVRITSAFQGEVSERDVKITIEVTDTGSGARDVRLFRNGSLVKVWHGDALQNGEKKAALEATIPIVAGENRFVAYAFSNANIKSSDSELMIRGAQTLRRPAVAHVLAIGINQYSNADFNLKFAVPDAQAFGENLQQALSKTGKYQKAEITLLLDADATREKIFESLQKLKEANPEDAVFVYYAGHGTAEGSRFYLVPQQIGYSGSRDNLDSEGMKTILEHGISDLDLEKAFEEMDASQILFVIDACNSGQALESPEKRFGLMNSKGLAQLAYEKGMYVLAAAQGYQAALEAAQLGHGYLTYALVEEGLKTAAADTMPQDGEVWVREWLDYSTMRVPQMQKTQMEQARLLKHELAFIPGEEKIEDLRERNVQRPRVFYRRESELQPLVIARPQTENK